MFQSPVCNSLIISFVFCLGLSGCMNNVFSPAKSMEGTWVGTNVHKTGYNSQASGGVTSIDSMVNMTFVFKKIDKNHLECIYAGDTLLLKTDLHQASYESRKGSNAGFQNHDRVIVLKAKKRMGNSLNIIYQKSVIDYDYLGYRQHEITFSYNGIFEHQK